MASENTIDHEKGAEKEAKIDYPKKKTLLPAMAALYLVVFLVALVRLLTGLSATFSTDRATGQDYSRHSDPSHL